MASHHVLPKVLDDRFGEPRSSAPQPPVSQGHLYTGSCRSACDIMALGHSHGTGPSLEGELAERGIFFPSGGRRCNYLAQTTQGRRGPESPNATPCRTGPMPSNRASGGRTQYIGVPSHPVEVSRSGQPRWLDPPLAWEDGAMSVGVLAKSGR